MSLKPETIRQLQTLIQADPALTAQLQSCTDAATSAAVLAKAASAKGIEVNTLDVVAHFESAIAQQGAMSDADLEQVSGGGGAPGWALSVFSLGLGCAIVSIADAANKKEGCMKGL